MKLGYKGQGIIIASRESNKTAHGRKVAEVLKMIAPEAEIWLDCDYKASVTDFDIYTTSLSFNSDKYEINQNKAKKLYEQDKFLVCAVGNNSEDSQTAISTNPYFQSIGACTLKNGKPKRAYYSSVTDDIDFMSLTSFDLTDGEFDGSSCAAPIFAAMCALVQCYYLKNMKFLLSNEELLMIVRDNCIDLNEEGHDPKTGYGLFILPDLVEMEGERDMSSSVIKREVRYKYLKDVPAGEFHDVIKYLVDQDIIRGRAGMGELTVVDLSDDMVRMWVQLSRAGVVKTSVHSVSEV